MNKPEPGSLYERPDGAWVRVDAIKDGVVYYVAARPGWEHGNAWRRPLAEFCELMGEEGMCVVTDAHTNAVRVLRAAERWAGGGTRSWALSRHDWLMASPEHKRIGWWIRTHSSRWRDDADPIDRATARVILRGLLAEEK